MDDASKDKEDGTPVLFNQDQEEEPEEPKSPGATEDSPVVASRRIHQSPIHWSLKPNVKKEENLIQNDNDHNNFAK